MSGAGGMIVDAMADSNANDASTSGDGATESVPATRHTGRRVGWRMSHAHAGRRDRGHLRRQERGADGKRDDPVPFKTIFEASNLAAPAVAVTRRTIHVKGNMAVPDYVESQLIQLKPRVTLTSDYDAQNPGGVATVRVFGRSDCTAYTGAAPTVFCAIAMDNDSRLEKVTVRVTGASINGTGNGVVTTSILPANSSLPPAITDVIAESASESGFRIYGSVTLGPRVVARNNKNGLSANRLTTAALATIQIIDAPVSGNPSNAFTSNTFNGGGNGITVFGNYHLTIQGAYATSNTNNGIVIGTPYTATTGVGHLLNNVHADGNAQNGLRVIGGEVHMVAAPSTLNTFNNNAAGYGIEATTGDAIGDVRIILEPKAAAVGYSIAHQANGNHLAGIHLNRAQPPGPGPNALPHSIASLEARQNGSGDHRSGHFRGDRRGERAQPVEPRSSR